MVRLQTLDLRIGVRVPASQPIVLKALVRSPLNRSRRFLAAILRIIALDLWEVNSIIPQRYHRVEAPEFTDCLSLTHSTLPGMPPTPGSII